MNRFLLATRNPHKTREFSEILGEEFVVRDLSAEPDAPSIEETGTTFEENAILKAVAISKRVPGLVVADDSGLEVDALGGAPGIYSARYAGPDAKDNDNIARLLLELRKLSIERPYWARFRCVLALARDRKLLDTFVGVVEGAIVESPRGIGGFNIRTALCSPTIFSGVRPAGTARRPETLGGLLPLCNAESRYSLRRTPERRFRY